MTGDGEPVTEGNVTIHYNGVNYNRAINSEGYASVGVNLLPGDYPVVTVYEDAVAFNTIIVSPNYLVESETDWIIDYPDDFTFTMIDNKTHTPFTDEPITVNLNGVLYEEVTDNEGKVNINLNAPVGEYILTFDHDDEVQSKSLVIRDKYNMETYDLTKQYGDPQPFIVHLTEHDGTPLTGKTITFHLNGTEYNRTTDNEGYAKLKINLPQGRYTITSTYETVVKTNTITITSNY